MASEANNHFNSMGRKSKAKKINQPKPQEIQKPKRNFFGFLSSEKKVKSAPVKNKKIPSKKIKEAKQALKKVDKKRVVVGTLITLILVVLMSIGYVLFQKAFRVQSIAKYLPKNETVAFLEINANFDHNQVIKATKLLSQTANYSKESLIQKLEQFFGLSYENEVKPWLGRTIGIASMNSLSGEDLHLIYFAEFNSKVEFEKFIKLKKFTKEIYKGKPVYIGENLYLSTLDNYLFTSKKKEGIHQILDFQVDGGEALNSDSEYRKVEKNLPLNKMVFFYVNFDKVKDNLFKELAFLSETGLSLANLSPFLRLFDSEGVALVAMDDNFALQSYLNFDDLVLNGLQSNDFSQKYTATLTDYIPKDVGVVWGSHNLESQLTRLMEILSAGDENTFRIFENFVENYAKKYFGAETSLQGDIYPLFKEEFAFTVKASGEANIYTLLLKLDSPQKNSVTIHEIANNFTSIGAIFEPKVVEHVLPDGTVGKEIIAAHEEIIKTQSPYKDTTIYELKMSKQDWGIYFALFNDVAVISNNFENIKATFDRQNSEENFRKDILFSERVEPIVKSAGEVLYVNFENILSALTKQKELPEFFNVISSLSSGKNYFNDGIVTISYIYLK